MAEIPAIVPVTEGPLVSDSDAAFDAKAFPLIASLNPFAEGNYQIALASQANAFEAKGYADNALAAALGGDLPPLTGKALQYLRVNAGETAAEFSAIPTQATAVWEAGTDTNESLVSAAKVAAAIAAQVSGGWETITTVTLSGATQIDFTGFDASRYDDYEIVFRDVDMSDATQPAIQMQMSTDGGSTFASGSTDYASLAYIANLNNTEAQTVNGDTDASAMALGYNASSSVVAEVNVFGVVRIHAPASNAVTCVDFVIVGKSFSATDDGFCERRGTGIYKGNNIVNAVRVSELRGSTFNSGQIELRGRVK